MPGPRLASRLNDLMTSSSSVLVGAALGSHARREFMLASPSATRSAASGARNNGSTMGAGAVPFRLMHPGRASRRVWRPFPRSAGRRGQLFEDGGDSERGKHPSDSERAALAVAIREHADAESIAVAARAATRLRAQKAARAASKGERANRGSRKANDLVRQ
jgi:hypothetical protein